MEEVSVLYDSLNKEIICTEFILQSEMFITQTGIPRNTLFQQDGAPAHFAESARKLFQGTFDF